MLTVATTDFKRRCSSSSTWVSRVFRPTSPPARKRVYDSVKAKAAKGPRLIAYRNRWLDALLVGQQVEAVVSLGTAANDTWQLWKDTPAGQASSVVHAAVTHPTEPESSSKGDKPSSQRLLRKYSRTGTSACRFCPRRYCIPTRPDLSCSMARPGPKAIGCRARGGLSCRPSALDARKRRLGAAPRLRTMWQNGATSRLRFPRG
jgi:hypothetical protein